MQSPDVIYISDSEEGERYLTIYYENSLKFIEIPLSDDRRLLLTDVKALEPNIAALNLTKEDEFKRLYKPKNGCFKEPAEKWSSFKVFAILNDSKTTHSVKKTSAVKMNVDLLSLSNLNVEPEATRVKQDALSSSPHGDESSPSTSVQLINTSVNNSIPLNYDTLAELRTFPRKARTRHIKKKACDSSLKFNDSVLDKNSGKPFDFFVNKFVPDYKINIFVDMKCNLIHRITIAQLNVPFDDPLLLSKFVFLDSNKKNHPNLKNIFPAQFLCEICNKNLRKCDGVVSHLLKRSHVREALTQDELNKLIQAVSFIDYSDDGFFYKNRKRNHQEPLNSTAAAKHQRKD